MVPVPPQRSRVSPCTGSEAAWFLSRFALVLFIDELHGDHLHLIERLEELAVQGQDVLDSVLLPIDSAISGWPAVTLGPDAAWYLQRGQPVTAPRVPDKGWVRIYEGDSRFIGIGEVTPDGRIAPKRLFRLGNGCL